MHDVVKEKGKAKSNTFLGSILRGCDISTLLIATFNKPNRSLYGL